MTVEEDKNHKNCDNCVYCKSGDSCDGCTPISHFGDEILESKPLTKDDLICSGCNHRAGDKIVSTAKGCCPDGDYSLIKLRKLKSALEEFEKQIEHSMGIVKTNFKDDEVHQIVSMIAFDKALDCMKKAFPVIYENEEKKP